MLSCSGVPPTTAIVVLGQSLNKDGSAPPTLTLRAQTAASYFQSTSSPLSSSNPVVIVTGGDPANVGRSESSVMFAALVSFGVPQSAILEEPESLTTLENAWFVAPLLPSGTTSVVVVTSDFHVPRARLVFEAVFAYRLSLASMTDVAVTMLASPSGCCPAAAPTPLSSVVNSRSFSERLSDEERNVKYNLPRFFGSHIRGGVVIPLPSSTSVAQALQDLAALRTPPPQGPSAAGSCSSAPLVDRRLDLTCLVL
jgi:hypothetical protein